MTTTETASTETAPELGTLTADDVAALRMADDVSFHHRDGEAFIRVYIGRAGSNPPRVYSGREQRLFTETDSLVADRTRTMPVPSHVHGHTNRAAVDGPVSAWTERTYPSVACYASPYGSARYSRKWATLAGVLRVGDVISLAWTADNNTETLRTAGLHADELALLVSRRGKPLEFHVDYHVGPDNSARMIRRDGY